MKIGKFWRIIGIYLLSGGLCITAHAQQQLYPNEFDLGNVTLLPGPFKHAFDLNVKTLLQYNVDRLLAGYRKEAGLPAKAKSYSNWDGLDGHVGGHYLTALAIHKAAANDAECSRRLEYMIGELKACQEANTANYPWGKGYLGAVPGSAKIWSTFQKGDFAAFRASWVAWYNLHKMYAGLRDAWLYTGNATAKQMFLAFCDWAIFITNDLSDAQMQTMLDIEHGGMNEVLADAYQLTNDPKYLSAAKRFSHRMLLDAMAEGNDNLDNKHANTQVPKAIGFQRIGELSHDEIYSKAGQFFWQTVTGTRSLAFGGNSRREFFPSVQACSEFVTDVEGPETCNSYNMLKLTEGLFRQKPSAALADYYERTLFNHILSSQHPEHGGYVYFTPARPRHYRVYSAPNEGMWCCVGSGMENHGKYGQFIYSHAGDSLFINLFIASELNWKEKGIKIRQETQFPDEENTSLTIKEGSSDFALKIRYPGWVKPGTLKVIINGKPLVIHAQPGEYLTIRRRWSRGDKILVHLPMQNRLEPLPNVPHYYAFMRGPILLAASTGTEDLAGMVAGSSRWGHIAGGKKLPVSEAPIIIESDKNLLAGKLKKVKGQAFLYQTDRVKLVNASGEQMLQPFSRLHDARYIMYWMVLSEHEYQRYVDSVSALERERMELDKRTVDAVATGEQQPEADHLIQKENSNTGNFLDAFWRDARNGGFFSYQLNTNGHTDVSLMVRYWGQERGNRSFEIYIDEEKLASENIAGKWNKAGFQEVVYPVPETMLKGKQQVRVKFKSVPGGAAGPVYFIRLIGNKK